MYKVNITWKQLAEHISNMSEEEKNSPVMVWGEDQNLCSDVAIQVDKEDMCCDPECFEDECFLRSDYGGDNEDDLKVVVPAGKTYLSI